MTASMKTCLILFAALAVTACGGTPSTECKSIGRANAIKLAKEQKRGMLSRSVDAERINFAANNVVPAEGDGFADVVGFKGKDGRTLVALIYEDCDVEWTYQ